MCAVLAGCHLTSTVIASSSPFCALECNLMELRPNLRDLGLSHLLPS